MRPSDYYGQGITPHADDLAVYPKLRSLGKIARGLSAERILDIGCNDSSVSIILSELINPKESFGVDISPVAVAAACENGFNATVLNIDEVLCPLKIASSTLLVAST